MDLFPAYQKIKATLPQLGDSQANDLPNARRPQGPITRTGKEKARQAALKHGGCTKKAMVEHKEAMQLIKMSKDILGRL